MESYITGDGSAPKNPHLAEAIQETREALIEGYNNHSLKLGDNFEHPGVSLVNELIGDDTLFSEEGFNKLKSMRNFSNVDVTLLWCKFLRNCETLEDLESGMERIGEQLAKLEEGADDHHDFFRVSGLIECFYGRMKDKLKGTHLNV